MKETARAVVAVTEVAKLCKIESRARRQDVFAKVDFEKTIQNRH